MTLLNKLIDRFKGFGYRHSYVESFLDSYIATQIKVLRQQRDLSQAKLAKLAGMHQSQIASLEDINNSSWKISTLGKLARAFDLVLVVRFESFGKILPEIDRFGRAMLQRPSFDQDPAFAPSMLIEATAYTQAGAALEDEHGSIDTVMAVGARMGKATYFTEQVRQRVA